MTDEELNAKIDEFLDSIPATLPYSEQLEMIHKIKEPDVRNQLYIFLCNVVINRFIFFRYRKSDNTDLLERDEARAFVKAVPFIPEEYRLYYQAVAEYFKGNYDKALEILEQDFAPKKGLEIDEYMFAHSFLVFTNVTSSFWDRIIEIIKSNQYETGLIELAKAVKDLYCSSSEDDYFEDLTKALQVNPNSELANELMGFYYMKKQRYANEIACLERVGTAYTVPATFIHFYLGWCYGEVGDHKSEIESYQECLDIDPYFEDARNNLGLAYYKTRQYQKAVDVFKQCIDMETDLKYACSNYVVALAALGKYRTAHMFIKNSPYKVRKYALDRLEAAESGKVKIPPAQKKMLETESAALPKLARDNISQFSNEKLLEDELEARLRNGSNVFGVHLRIYKRKGEYGQQFIIPIGRLDLLAEDDNGDLYVIELKKDSGYDDAFLQTKQYVDYLEKSELASGKHVKGIICLSNPTSELIEAVKSDDRISLFEYQISYTKII